MSAAQSFKPHYALFAGIASMGVVLVLIAVKTAAYIDSGSASVLASLMDSLLDATVSLAAFMAIRYSLKPADKDHRFGHGKIEGLAALLQAVMIAFAGVALVWEALHRFNAPHNVTGHGFAIGVMIFSIVLSALLVAVQNRSLRHAPSLAVESDRAHYSMDILINAAVIVIMIALKYGAPGWIDPAFALCVAAFLAGNVIVIGMKGVDMLLDRELPAAVREDIKRRVRGQAGVLGMHDLRTRRSGMHSFISFDIEVDGDLSMRESHEIVRRVEMVLVAVYPDADIFIHADPHGDTEDTRHRVRGVHH